MRKTFITTLIELARKDKRVFLITPDIGYSVLEPFKNEFPERFLNVGVAEQNAIGMAAGLALSGLIPYVYTINPFVCMRPFEQVRVDMAYMNTNVRIVGVGAGFAYGSAGATHHSIEDIAIMRALPNMTVVCPGDPWEVSEAIKESLNYVGPMFFRLSKQGEPVINSTKTKFRIGKATKIRSGNHLHIITTSNTLEMANNVCEILKQKKITASLISMHTIKPLDVKMITELLKTKKPIFTLEEHSIIGGLGGAVAEVIAESNYNPLFKRLGVNDKYSHYVGGHDFIRAKFGLTKENVAKNILNLIGKK
ncbi:MAG TPA: transketolase C-terminal domain-containing protein [Bacteroidia bacterium]|nr:transketolase C-terminal domain-containing protein [Bacteroidia bacterium]HNU33860.1 transketolase C-terminal domain-containing protein [Bacteroidia bacterium]